MEDGFSLTDDFEEVVLAGTLLSYVTPHVTDRHFHELRTGQLAFEATLKLTGMDKDAARQALAVFLKNQIKKGNNCVLIIHGNEAKGSEPPLLKNLVNHWLPQIKEVTAFHSASMKDGGAAALYVLLQEIKLPDSPSIIKDESSFLAVETKKMERRRRLAEQQGERQWASVKAREHATEEPAPSPEGELQNTMLQHPELNNQRFDGVDPNLNPEPPLNTDARREFDNEKREQEMEKQLRLGNMPTFTPKITPRGP